MLLLINSHVLATCLDLESGLRPRLSQPFFTKLCFGLVLIEIPRKLEPCEEFWPSVNLELELEPQIGRQSDEVIEVVRCEDTTDYAVGAKRKAFDLVGSFNKVGGGEQAGLLQELVNVKDNNCPPVDIKIERYLHNKAILR